MIWIWRDECHHRGRVVGPTSLGGVGQEEATRDSDTYPKGSLMYTPRISLFICKRLEQHTTATECHASPYFSCACSSVVPSPWRHDKVL